MLRKNAKDYRVRRQPNTAAGRALHAVAAFFGAIARAVLRRRNAEAVRNFDVGSVLETFLREGENIRYSSTVEAERARDARTRATVVDEDGTVVAYHTAGMDFGSGIIYTQYNKGVSNTTAMSALRLVAGHPISVSPDTLNRSVAILTGTFSPYDNQGRKIRFNPNGTRAKGGSGLLHLVDERVANDYAELYLSGDRDGAIKKAATDLLRVIEAVQHGHIVEVRGNRNTPNQVILEHKNEADGETYRAVVSWDRKENGFTLTTGYRVDPKFAKTQVDVNTGESSVVLRRSEFLTSEYYGHLKRKLPELTRQIVAELFPDLQGENGDANEERMNHISDGSVVSAEMNEWYLDAVFGNDMDAAKRMVVEAAYRAGYTIPAYHGTLGFGFTVFDSRRMRDGTLRPEERRSIFFAKSLRTASSYSNAESVREIDVENEVPPSLDVSKIHDDVSLLAELKRIADVVGATVREGDDGSIVLEVEKYGEKRRIAKCWKISTLADRDGMPLERAVRRIDHAITYDLGSYYGSRANYEVALKMENPFVIDAQGRNWNDIEMPDGRRMKTRDVAEWALARGYDGVVFRNVKDFGEFAENDRSPDTVYIVFDSEQVKSLDPVTYDDNGELIPLSDRFNPENVDIRWHETRGAGSRFTETPLGQELVAHAFDVLIGVDADLLLRPWHYGEKREPGKGLVTAGLGRELDMNEAKGLAAEVSARISRFGTREGDPTLREIRARCGSKERFYEVLGAVFEAAVGLKLGVQDVITQREFGTMEKRMPLYAWVIRHNAQARATALGRKAYIMGRAFAERLHKEALAAARAEVERQRAKASEARAQTREAKAQTRNAERREETARIKLKKAEFSAAEADFIARWRLAEERAISRMRIESVREQMKESIVTLRVREAQKRAVERERGVSFLYLKGTLGVDIRAELRALAGSDGDPVEVASELLRRIELGFDKWVREQRPELLENSGSYWQLLNEQGEKAYRETMGNVLKAVARELSYGKLRESILNAIDLFAHSKHEIVHDAVEAKLARVISILRIAQNADVVALTKRRIKSALAEANKRLSSEASSARTRYMTSMRRLCRELLDTFEDAVDAQGVSKTAEKKRQKLTEMKHALEEEIEKINDGKDVEGLAKDETLTERQHKDAVKLMFLERFGDLSYDLDPEKVWAKSAEAEGFVRDALFEHVLAWEAKKEAAAEMSARLMDALPQARGWVKRGSVLFGALIPSWFDRMKWPLKTAAARSVIDEFERRFAQAATSEARAQTREAKAQTRNAERREETARIKLKKAKRSVKGGWRDPIVVRGQPL